MELLEQARSRVGGVLRVVLGPLAWIYCALTLFVLDVDSAVLSRVAPSLLWVLPYKLLGVVAATTTLLVFLGTYEFAILSAYVIGYPFVVMFWIGPKQAYKNWPIVVAFAPATYDAAMRIKSTLAAYTILSFSLLTIHLASNSTALTSAFACSAAFLAVHLLRSIRKAYSAGLFSQLGRLAKRAREAVQNGESGLERRAKHSEARTPEKDDRVLTFYLFHSLAQLFAEKTELAARARYYDLYLMGSWLYTVAVTAIVFGFMHFGVYKLSHDAYSGVTQPSIWSFIGYSIGMITPSSISSIHAVSDLASGTAYAEVACGLLLVVIFAFSILTASREAFRDDIYDFQIELRGLAAALEARASVACALTMVQMEQVLMNDNATIVNGLRRFRGLPELSEGVDVIDANPRSGSSGD